MTRHKFNWETDRSKLQGFSALMVPIGASYAHCVNCDVFCVKKILRGVRSFWVKGRMVSSSPDCGTRTVQTVLNS